MDHKIITISRQYGSGGRIIGKKLAEALNIPFYDNELINLAAEKTGLSKECFKEAESVSTGNLLLSLTTLTPTVDSYGLPLNEKNLPGTVPGYQRSSRTGQLRHRWTFRRLCSV
ncbi:MAG: cytidylate kinase family protein [Anaerotignum sp.]